MRSMRRFGMSFFSAVVGISLMLLLVTQAATDGVEDVACVCSQQHEESPYVIIIDGGSTGSRLHIFEFLTDTNGTTTSPSVVQRRGSTRVDSPLSAFGPTHDEPWVDSHAVALHLWPLWDYAATRIPHCYHRTTPIQYAATAGMRLLTETAQQQVYRAAVEGLLQLQASRSSSFQFSRKMIQFATLSGELEGYYGAVAANYLHNMSNNNNNNNSSSKMILGALDMGGASAQVVYPHPWTESMDEQEQTCVVDDLDHVTDESNDASNDNSNSNGSCSLDNFFSVSYLSYGVDQFRKRLWNLLVWEHINDKDAKNDDSCDAGYVENPCLNPGFTVPWENGYTLLGTGDAAACQQQVRRLLPHPHAVVDENDDNNNNNPQKHGKKRVVGGIEHPPIPPGQRFVAQSLYFFTLDSLRQFSGDAALNAAWPTPTLSELDAALPKLCQRDWESDLRHDRHGFTSPTALPHRCFESVYLLQLLQHGLGLDPHTRDILFAYELNDSEVEWTLGMALSMRRRRVTASVGSDKSSDSVKGADQESTIIAGGVAESTNLNPTTTTTIVAKGEAAAATAHDSLSDISTNETNTPTTTTTRARWIQLVAEVLVSDNVGFFSGSGSYATLR